MPSWWIDELRTVGAEHLDAEYVATYDAKSAFDPAQDLHVLADMGMDGTSTVIDLGAGTGAFTLPAARTAQSVIAVDPSPAMNHALEQRVAELELTNVRVVNAGFLSYRHEGEPVDFAYSRNALHQLPDFWKVMALRHVAGLLRPGGTLRLRDVAFDTEPDQVEDAVEAWLERSATDPARGYTAAELAEHLRSEFSTFTWLLEPMLERAGFDIIDRDLSAATYASYTCRRRP